MLKHRYSKPTPNLPYSIKKIARKTVKTNLKQNELSKVNYSPQETKSQSSQTNTLSPQASQEEEEEESYTPSVSPMQRNKIMKAKQSNTWDLTELGTDLQLMQTKIGKLFEEESKISSESFNNVKYLYAMLKKIKKKTELYTGKIYGCISNFEFMRYIHQSIYFDLIHKEMLDNPKSTPQQYKHQAKCKLNKTLLKNCLEIAITEGEYTLNDEDINLYVNNYTEYPPLHSIYYYDSNNIYQKIKESYGIFNSDTD